MLLVVGHDGRREREDTREEVIRHEGNNDADNDGELSQITQVGAPDATEHLVGHGIGRDGRGLRQFEGIKLVGLLKEV